MSIDNVSLSHREAPATIPTSRNFVARGITIEHVVIDAPAEVEFKWSGSVNYLAIHDMKMKDGETVASGIKPFRLLDLRRRMTYLPAGAEISGWSAFSARSNSFTAIKFDFDNVYDGHYRSRGIELRPRLYFGDQELLSTMTKLHALLRTGDDVDPMLLESIGVLAVAELAVSSASTSNMERGARLGASQQRLLVDYIEGNLGRKVTLSELAGVLGLNRFYFSRCFTATFLMPPYQYMLLRRIEKAKELLRHPGTSTAAVAAAVGFASSSQFTSLFKRATGQTPREYRLSAL